MLKNKYEKRKKEMLLTIKFVLVVFAMAIILSGNLYLLSFHSHITWSLGLDNKISFLMLCVTAANVIFFSYCYVKTSDVCEDKFKELREKGEI